MRIRRIAFVIAAVMVAACGSQSMSMTELVARPHAGRPYRLFTHCGIEWAKIDGTFWRAKHPLTDGNGNPPAGWGNPFQEGTLVLTGPTTARFVSPVGSVSFERTSRRQPPVICS
jgi:hypothetical protein